MNLLTFLIGMITAIARIMKTTQYYLMTGVKNQPVHTLRVKIIDAQNGGEFVMVQVCDLALLGQNVKTVAHMSNLTPCE